MSQMCGNVPDVLLFNIGKLPCFSDKLKLLNLVC